MIKKIITIFFRKLISLRFQPIRIFCLHHVCEQFDAEVMYFCDWMEFSLFKKKINNLRKQGYVFISLTEAHYHMQNDHIRWKKYAVLTFDDGYKTLHNILPWLDNQQIPVTLFINGKYLDGVSYRENPKEKFLNYDELFSLTSNLIEIGHHGWDHADTNQITEEKFVESVKKNIELLSKHPRYVPFWAYTYGRYRQSNNIYLSQIGIIPVCLNNKKNYTWRGFLDRELL